MLKEHKLPRTARHRLSSASELGRPSLRLSLAAFERGHRGLAELEEVADVGLRDVRDALKKLAEIQLERDLVAPSLDALLSAAASRLGRSSVHMCLIGCALELVEVGLSARFLPGASVD